MVHSRIKLVHTKQCTTRKQTTIRSRNNQYLERTIGTKHKQNDKENVKVVITKQDGTRRVPP